jgi:Abnormal spindle-like microcephaly-assoc'd, ASPM-SPD-2-Hydin
VGTTSAVQNLTLSNPGNAPLTINSIIVTGADRSDFTEANHCSSNVAANSFCVLNISFTPTAVGNRTAILNISDDAVGSPQTVTLTGTAVQTTASLEPTNLSFPLVQLAQTPSQPAAVTVMNNGTGVLAITGISFAGANPRDFNETDTCRGNIGAGAYCSIQVTFKPMAAGVRSASLTLTDNGSNSPQTVALSGIAMDYVILPTIPGATALTVTAGQSATYSLEINSLNGFAGQVSLTCTGTPNACTIPATLSVTANSSATFQVTVPTIAPSLIMPTSPGATTTMNGNQRSHLIAILPVLLLTAVPVPLLVVVARLLASKPRRGGLLLGTQRFALTVALGVVLGLALAGCGATGVASGNPGTPAGRSNLTITAATGAGLGMTSRTLSLTLTVQNPND